MRNSATRKLIEQMNREKSILIHFLLHLRNTHRGRGEKTTQGENQIIKYFNIVPTS
jgi:hypothetical protein